MDYEEKYKAALERARALNDGKDVDVEAGTTTCEYIFPELQDSESERTRKELIDFLKLPHSRFVGNREHEKWIAWLEKQGKQDARYEDIEKLLEADTIYQMAMNDAMVEEAKSKAINALSELAISKILGLEKQGIQTTDKVEPKFKVGDWIVLPLGIIARIDSLNSTDYQVTTTDGKICDFKISKQDNYRLWSITDAKDGDLIYVSTEEKGIQAIFHEYKNDTIFFHCYLCTDFVQGGYMPIGSVELTYPLQKTHYNRFFEKMHEAGYEWDGEKKELKKIESNTLDPDKVIEWLKAKVYDDSTYGMAMIDKFKKDFGL